MLFLEVLFEDPVDLVRVFWARVLPVEENAARVRGEDSTQKGESRSVAQLNGGLDALPLAQGIRGIEDHFSAAHLADVDSEAACMGISQNTGALSWLKLIELVTHAGFSPKIYGPKGSTGTCQE